MPLADDKENQHEVGNAKRPKIAPARSSEIHDGMRTLDSLLLPLPMQQQTEEKVSASDTRAFTPCSYNLARHVAHREIVGTFTPWPVSRLSHMQSSRYREICVADGAPWRTPVLYPGNASNQLAHVNTTSIVRSVEFDSTGELLLAGMENGIVLVHSAETLLRHRESQMNRCQQQRGSFYDPDENEGSAGGSPPGPPNRHMQNGDVSSIPPQRQPPPPIPQSQPQSYDMRDVPILHPVVSLWTGLSKLQNVRWNIANENVIGVASALSRSLLLYDLAHTQGDPTSVLTMPSTGSGGIGAGDIAFLTASSHGYAVAAGGPSGQVFVWDSRACGAPVATLQSISHGGAVTSLQLAENDMAVVVGTQNGETKVWDLRGNGGSALRFGGVLHRHPMLACVNLRMALAQVHGLLEQAGGIPPCSVQCLALDPFDSTRAAFHLGCGWSGVLDIPRGKITHVHAPPQLMRQGSALGDELEYDPHRGHNPYQQRTLRVDDAALGGWGARLSVTTPHVRGAWMANGTRFAVPSRETNAVLLLDFAKPAFAGCSAAPGSQDDGAADDDDRSRAEIDLEKRRCPPAATVELSQAGYCVAAAPRGEAIVIGGYDGVFSVCQP